MGRDTTAAIDVELEAFRPVHIRMAVGVGRVSGAFIAMNISDPSGRRDDQTQKKRLIKAPEYSTKSIQPKFLRLETVPVKRL